jgi:hypothetical protein
MEVAVKAMEQAQSWAVENEATDANSALSAQYLRLAMFVLVVVLGVSIVLATTRSGGELEGSISDYFHTPARLALVGTMVSIGICLMVLYSTNPLENFLLNVAGAFAPIVGFAATTQTTMMSAPFDFDVTTADVDALARASLPAYFAALVLLACFVGVVHPEGDRLKKAAMTVVAIIGLAGLTWLMWEHGRRKIHVVAAIGFFLPLIVLIFAKATSGVVGVKLRRTYLAIGVVMVVSALAYWIDRGSGGSRYATLIVEVTLIVCFAVYWLLEYIRIAPRSRALEQG